MSVFAGIGFCDTKYKQSIVFQVNHHAHWWALVVGKTMLSNHHGWLFVHKKDNEKLVGIES